MSISKSDLLPGAFYHVNARNFTVAVWTGETFRGAGLVNRVYALVDEAHYDDGIPFGSATPVERVGSLAVRSPYSSNDLLAALQMIDEVILTAIKGLT